MSPSVFSTLLELLATVEGKKKAYRLQRKKSNCHYLWKTWIVYVENSKTFMKKLPEVKGEFIKDAIYMLNM